MTGEAPKRKTRRRTKGDGALYKAQRTGLWTASVELPPDESGKRRRAVVSSKDRNTALAKLRTLRKQVEEGHVPTKGRKPTMTKVCNDWLDTRVNLDPDSVSSYRSSINTQISPHIGDRPITVDAAEVRKMLHDWVSSGVALSTMQKAFHVLRSTFKWAQREGFRPDNPLDRIEPPFPTASRRNRKPSRSLSASEVERLFAVAQSEPRDPYYERWAFQLLHGIRQRETLGLTVGAIDFEHLTVDVSWQVKRIRLKKGFKPEPGVPVYPRDAFAIPYNYECIPLWRAYCKVRTKTRKQRLLPLAAPLVADLKAYIESTPREPEDLIWTRPGGEPIDPMEDLSAWKTILLRAGIPEAGTHISRHTANTLLLQRGVPEELRKQILGHSTAVAHEAYTHVDLEMAREAMGKLDDLLSPAQG